MLILPCIWLLAATSMTKWRPAQASCVPPYSRFHENHTFCQDANQDCQLLDNTVSPEQVEEIVRIHNELRSRLAVGNESTGNLPSAADMLAMEWDEELAAIAQNHANQCAFEHDCNECRKTSNFDVGQNLFQRIWWYPLVTPPIDWTYAVEKWYEEVEDFNSSIINEYDPSKATGVIGHFTQVVWSRTWRIGCGYTAFHQMGTTIQLYTCNYGPSGNIYLNAVYQPAPACSKCPENTCCGESCQNTAYYPGLCHATKDSSPNYSPEAGKYLYFCDFSDEKACEIVTPKEGNPWEITHTLSGSYIGIVLKEGESSHFKIRPTIGAFPKTCIVLVYRKGPDVAGEESGNIAQGHAIAVGRNLDITLGLKRDSPNFKNYLMNLGMKMPYKLSVHFEALKGTQYLEIKQISVKEGACK